MLTNDHADHENRGRKHWIGEEEKQRLLEQHEQRAKDRQAEANRTAVEAVRFEALLKEKLPSGFLTERLPNGFVRLICTAGDIHQPVSDFPSLLDAVAHARVLAGE